MEKVKSTGRGNLPEQVIVYCSDVEQTREVANFYKKDTSNWSYWPYVIAYNGDKKLRSDMLFKHIPDRFNLLPILTFGQWKDLLESESSEFVLPPIWYVIVTKENVGVLSKWRGVDLHVGQITGMAQSDWHPYPTKEHNPINSTSVFGNEITFEQFKKYVLKQKEEVMETYRIKTKEEFIAEFGTDFHSKVNSTWNTMGGMDYLFGATISKEDYDYIIANRGRSKTWSTPTNKGSYWRISADMITNKPLNKTTSMKQNFAISGTEVLKEAFIRASGVKPVSKETASVYSYLSGTKGGKIQGGESTSNKKCFNLPEDWNAALAYVKDYFTPVITEKKVKFADLTLTIKSGDNFATSSHGKITKAQVEKVLSMFDKKIDICGYELEIEGVNGIELKFGCQVGTVGQAKNLLKAFDE